MSARESCITGQCGPGEVAAAGGPAPAQDWRPRDVTPHLSKAMTCAALTASRDAICAAFGLLPGLACNATTGPMVRVAQRHPYTSTLQPVATLDDADAKGRSDEPLSASAGGTRSRARRNRLIY